ncbi:hypothetical protein BC629DRAFT_1590159 [Irpex lacteus]|nr:hypothetical protein BC629DRAFT_1590159 [Irpex lacteus]
MAGHLQATGSLEVVAEGNKIKASFTDRNGLAYYFSGSLGVSVTPFKSSATLTYRSDGDLVASDAFQGNIGTNQFALNFDEGYTMSGIITRPIPKQVTVTGAGSWLAADPGRPPLTPLECWGKGAQILCDRLRCSCIS